MEQSEAISIHALRKESDVGRCCIKMHLVISIHALRKESDRLALYATVILHISIHALRKESDRLRGYQFPVTGHFNPRSP